MSNIHVSVSTNLIKPIVPCKPREPSEYLDPIEARIYIERYSELSIREIALEIKEYGQSKNIDEEVVYEDIYIYIDDNYDYVHVVAVYRFKTLLKDPKYEKNMQRYQTSLKRYEKELKNYQTKLKEYNESLKDVRKAKKLLKDQGIC